MSQSIHRRILLIRQTRPTAAGVDPSGVDERTVGMRIVALEEAFWVDGLQTTGSFVAQHPPLKPEAVHDIPAGS